MKYAFDTVDWLEYIWLNNKSWLRKNFYNAIEKANWAIWTHKNNIIFNGAKSNHVVILELASGIFHEIFVYGNCKASNISMHVKNSLCNDGPLLRKSGSNIQMLLRMEKITTQPSAMSVEI